MERLEAFETMMNVILEKSEAEKNEDGRTEDAGQGEIRYISTIYGQSLIL